MPRPKKPLDYLKLAQQLNKIQLQLYGFSVEEMIEIDNEQLSNEEIQNLSNDISSYYQKGFKAQLDKMIIQEMKGLAEEATDNLQIQFIRGSIAGLVKLKQWCQMQVPKSKEDQQEKQPTPGITL